MKLSEAILPWSDLVRSAPWTLRAIFELLRRRQYTGPVTLHLHEGRPVKLELPNPVTIRLDSSTPLRADLADTTGTAG